MVELAALRQAGSKCVVPHCDNVPLTIIISLLLPWPLHDAADAVRADFVKMRRVHARAASSSVACGRRCVSCHKSQHTAT
jgi:hypothetical protein